MVEAVAHEMVWFSPCVVGMFKSYARSIFEYAGNDVAKMCADHKLSLRHALMRKYCAILVGN